MNREADQEPAPDLPGRRHRARPRRDRAVAAHARAPPIRLSPTVRVDAARRRGDPQHPARATSSRTCRKPLVTGPDGLADAPRDRRRPRRRAWSAATSDLVYVARRSTPRRATAWYIYRPGRTLAALRHRRGARLRAALPRHRAGRALRRGLDRCASPARRRRSCSATGWCRRRREQHRQLRAARAGQAGQRPHHRHQPRLDRSRAAAGIVTIDKGSADGIDVGTVLAIYRAVPPIRRSAAVERAGPDRDRLPRVRDPVLAAGPDVPAASPTSARA